MKKKFFSCWVLCVCLQFTSPAQSIATMRMGMYRDNPVAAEDAFNRRGRLYNNSYYVMIDGQKVMGTTFWDPVWLAGSLIAGDGRVVDAFKFRYDAYYQVLYFLNGNDSFEVNEPVKEFTLKQPNNDSIVSIRFINGDQINKTDKPVYYQVMTDDTKGQLLKWNQCCWRADSN